MQRIGRIRSHLAVAVIITAVLALVPALARTTQHLGHGSSVRQSVTFRSGASQPPPRASLHRPTAPGAAVTRPDQAAARHHRPALDVPLRHQLVDASPGLFRAPPASLRS